MRMLDNPCRPVRRKCWGEHKHLVGTTDYPRLWERSLISGATRIPLYFPTVADAMATDWEVVP